MNKDRKAWNSTLRPVALRKIGLPKKPKLKAVVKRFKVVTAAMLGEPKKRKPIKKRRALRPGEQSQVEFFKELVTKREFVSEISGEPLFELPDEPTEAEFKHWVSQFSHLLNKGHYKAYKKVEINIVFKTPAEHELWEKHKERVTEHCEPQYREAWRRIVDRFIQLRNHANGIR